MSSMTRSSRSTTSPSGPSVLRWSRSHSTCSPAEIDEAMDRTSASSAPLLVAYLLCQTRQRSTDGHVCGGDRWLPEQLGDFGVGAAHLDAYHDRLAVLGFQARQGRFIALERRDADDDLERRRVLRGLRAVERFGGSS